MSQFWMGLVVFPRKGRLVGSRTMNPQRQNLNFIVKLRVHHIFVSNEVITLFLKILYYPSIFLSLHLFQTLLRTLCIY